MWSQIPDRWLGFADRVSLAGLSETGISGNGGSSRDVGMRFIEKAGFVHAFRCSRLLSGRVRSPRLLPLVPRYNLYFAAASCANGLVNFLFKLEITYFQIPGLSLVSRRRS
jgi:hypothetical protein